MQRCMLPHVLWDTHISLFQRMCVLFSWSAWEMHILLLFSLLNMALPVTLASYQQRNRPLFFIWPLIFLNTLTLNYEWSVFTHSVPQGHTCPVKLQWHESSVYLLFADRKIVIQEKIFKKGWIVSFSFNLLESLWRSQLIGLTPIFWKLSIYFKHKFTLPSQP